MGSKMCPCRCPGLGGDNPAQAPCEHFLMEMDRCAPFVPVSLELGEMTIGSVKANSQMAADTIYDVATV